MRRIDREVTDKTAIEEFIGKEQILRVAFYDDGEIYIVPVNYGYVSENDRYSFYFHGAKAGRKYELSKSRPTVGFEIDGANQLLPGDIACQFTARFQSVIGTGTLEIVADMAEKVKGLNALMRQISQKSQWCYSDKVLETTAVFRLDVQKLSCKRKM